MKPWKVSRAFQNNGPDYWVVQKQWAGPFFSFPLDQREQAEAKAAELNKHDKEGR